MTTTTHARNLARLAAVHIILWYAEGRLRKEVEEELYTIFKNYLADCTTFDTECTEDKS